MTNRFLRHLTGVSVLLLAGTLAHADVTFTTTGTTSGGSVKGTAKFVIGASQMTLTLTNTTTTVASIAQVLDGLDFTLTGGSGLSLNNVSATAFEDCSSGTCTTDGSFEDHTPPPPDTTLTSPFNWQLSGAYSLYAGNGSFKPAGIVNSSVTGSGGIPNAPHNDYLLGPVTFTFDFQAAPTDVTAATFYWGTEPESTRGTEQIIPTPEPGALVLLGTAVLSLGLGLRKRRQSV
jgi:hypothetical protein